MATLYQLHSPMNKLKPSIDQLALTWQQGDSVILLGTTVSFVDWLNAYVGDSEIDNIANLYALVDDVAKLDDHTTTKLNLDTKLTAVLTDTEWVMLTQDPKFTKVVTIAL